MADLLEYCIAREGVNVTDRTLLLCALSEIRNTIQADAQARNDEPTRIVLMVFAAAGVFFMQAGFAMVCAGAVRKKNVQNTMLKNLIDACGAAFSFYAFGYAFAFGGSDITSPEKTFIGKTNFFLMDVNTDLSFWVYQFAFSAASATIVAGALAERCQMTAYFGYSVIVTGFVYPIVVHAIWNAQGILSATNVDPLWGVGMIDFAGSGVVHITGGVTSLIAASILGPRRGRFYDDRGRLLDEPAIIKGYSPALQMLGTFILWFGWYSFNGGSALTAALTKNTAVQCALAATNSTIAPGVAGIVSLVFNMFWINMKYPGEGFYDLQIALNGSLAGLVAITAGCATLEPWAAVVVGTGAGIIYVAGNRLLLRLRIDDAVDAVPVHLFGGLWGLISTGLFTSPTRQQAVYGRSDHPGLFYSWRNGNSDATLLGVEILGILFIFVWVTVVLLPFFWVLDMNHLLRCDPLEEIIGLDVHEHGGVERIEERPEDDKVTEDHYEAYRKRREAKNAEILRKRSEISRFSSHSSYAVPSVNASAESGELTDAENEDAASQNSRASRRKRSSSWANANANSS